MTKQLLRTYNLIVQLIPEDEKEAYQECEEWSMSVDVKNSKLSDSEICNIAQTAAYNALNKLKGIQAGGATH